MKPELQDVSPANSETADSDLESEGREDSNPTARPELPANTNRDREGWRAYFPAAVRKTLRSRDDESRTGKTFQKLQTRFAKMLLALISVFFCFCGIARANIAVRPVLL